MHDVSGPSGDAGEKSESPSEKCTARAGPVNFYLLHPGDDGSNLCWADLDRLVSTNKVDFEAFGSRRHCRVIYLDESSQIEVLGHGGVCWQIADFFTTLGFEKW